MPWESTEASAGDREAAAREDALRRGEIQEELGMTEEEFQKAAMVEFGRLRDDILGYWSTGDLLEEAARNVEGRAKGE